MTPGPAAPRRGRELRRRYKRTKRWLVFQLLRTAIAILGALPETLAREIGRAIGRFASLVARTDRARAIEQMSRALSLPVPEAAERVRAMFVHFGETAAELALVAKDPSRVDRWVELDDASRATLDAVLAEGKGAIAVSAHLGNWELLPQRLARAGYPVFTAARQNANLHLDRWIVDRRSAAGITTVHRGGARAARDVLGALKRGALFALLIDQDTKVQSVMVPFFGRPASTPVAAAELALRGDRPVICGFIWRTERGHVMRIERVAVEPGDDAVALTARLTAIIEAQVRAHPEQWVWFHRRWRRGPDATG